MTGATDGDVRLPSGYELVRELGAGGCGVVYLARQTALQRLVAVKRIHGYALNDGPALQRFRREAQVLATMQHPAVVRVFDFRPSAQDAILVMEYVAGESLADRLERGPLTPSESLGVLRDVASALRAGTEHGITHRDIKPGNVFLLDDGHAKLGDFGLARIVSDPSVFRTTTGEVSGTPAYFPPECTDGEHEPDERSDAYSFAVMAYELLVGQLPFMSSDVMQILVAHMEQEPPPPSDVVPGFPPAASAALLSGLAKDPAQRLLPWELVARLSAVPASAWPAVPVTTPVRRKVAPSEPTVRGVVAPPGLPGALGPATPAAPPKARRGRRVRGRALLAAGGAVLVAGAVVLATTRGDADAPAKTLRVSSVDLTVVGATTGHCPGAIFTFRLAVATNAGAGRISLQWRRPDGQRSDVVHIPVAAGQAHATAELRFQVNGQRRLRGRATARVLDPNPLSARSALITYAC